MERLSVEYLLQYIDVIIFHFSAIERYSVFSNSEQLLHKIDRALLVSVF